MGLFVPDKRGLVQKIFRNSPLLLNMAKNIYRKFDYLGVLAFAWFLGVSVLNIIKDGFDWIGVVSLSAATAGFLIDGYFVFFCKD